jgi:N-acetylneuraminic acid mutarotase
MKTFSIVLVAFTFACGGTVNDSSDAGGDTGVQQQDAAVVDAPVEAAAQPLAAMETARSLFGAARCDDGRVRVFSGYGPLVLLSSVESYDETTNAWTQGSYGKVQRYAHTVAKGNDGSVYVIGGTSNGTSATGSVEVYTPASDAWSSIADLPTPRLGLGAATSKDGRVFAIGGGLPGSPTDVVEIWSPDTKTWSTGPSMPTPRLSLQAVTGKDGLIYAIGGRDAQTTPLTTVEALDPATLTWTTMPSMSTGRYWFGATAASDGRIYAVGGIGDDGFLDSVEALVIGGSWSPVTKLPEARGWLEAAATADGRVLAIGGADDTGLGQPPPVATMFSYDPTSQVWSQ